MKTLTIQINERSKAGRTILELLEIFSKDKKGVKIITPKNAETTKDYPISKNVPNAETERIMKENDKRGTKGLKKFDTVEELFEDLDI